MSCLTIEDLSICYHNEKDGEQAVDNVNIEIESGTSIGIIGESGSGKTSIAMSIMRLLESKAKVKGRIVFNGVSLRDLSEEEINTYRWTKISIVFQNNLEILNPVLNIKEQILECIRTHIKCTNHEAYKRVVELFQMVGLDKKWEKAYPHQLSGGMRQRVLIAMALSCNPEVLIVDEPTSSLDAIAKNEIVELLHRLHNERKFSMMVISHEMQTIKKLTSKVAVIYAGTIVEEGMTANILTDPMHTYTRGLIYSSPAMNPYRDLWGIPGEIGEKSEGQCPFYPRCNQRIEICKVQKPVLEYKFIERKVACNRGGIVTVLQGRNICKQYHLNQQNIKACDNCHIEIHSGEVVVMIGESGSGKTTLASILAGVINVDCGEILFDGKKVKGNSATSIFNGIQIVFQDPFSSTNEMMTIEQVIREPLDIINLGTKEEKRKKVIKALYDVGLPNDEKILLKKCYMLSGGQRQRISLARSLVMEPKLLIADEITSMLDPSTQANILRLLKGLQNSKGFSMLYITHDIALTRKIADKIYVMYKGEIIEKGMPDEIINHPLQEYTKTLVSKGLASFSCSTL